MPTSKLLHAQIPFINRLFSKANCMETNCPNILFNYQTKLLFEKTSQVMKQKLLLILLLVSFCSSMFAQGTRNSNEAIVVLEMNSILSTNGTSASARIANTGIVSINVQRLRNLITQVQPSEYFYSGEVKSYGDTPTNLFTDLSSLSQVNNSNINKQNIEIVTIRISTASELNSTIDLAAFSNFTSLKYIYFISNANTTSENISSHIVNYNNRFNLFYKIDRGDSNQ